jgi:hypothetical protein
MRNFSRPGAGRRGAGGRLAGRLAVAAACGAALVTGCGAANGAATTTQAPSPAGSMPSAVAAMICRSEAIAEINSAIGTDAVVAKPTWADHLYSCQYRYPAGSMRLSVKELSSQTQTTAYFHSLRVQLGDTGTIPNLGQGAFQTANGSLVVRKDWKVLLVDVAALHGQVGQPPVSVGDAAVTVADVILGCWNGD